MRKCKNKKPGYICLEEVFLFFFLGIIGFTITMCVLRKPIEKPISTDISLVEVEVVSVKHEESYVSTSYSAVDDKGTLVPIDTTYPERFITVIKHQDHTHTLEGKETYYFCYGKEGTTLKANVYVNEYKDGRQTHEIDIPLQ